MNPVKHLCFRCKKRPGFVKIEPVGDWLCAPCNRQHLDANARLYSHGTSAAPPNPNLKVFVLTIATGQVIRINQTAYCYVRLVDAATVLKKLMAEKFVPMNSKIREITAQQAYEWAMANQSNLIGIAELLPGWEDVLPKTEWWKIKKTSEEIARIEAMKTPEAQQTFLNRRQRRAMARAKQLGHLSDETV